MHVMQLTLYVLIMNTERKHLCTPQPPVVLQALITAYRFATTNIRKVTASRFSINSCKSMLFNAPKLFSGEVSTYSNCVVIQIKIQRNLRYSLMFFSSNFEMRSGTGSESTARHAEAQGGGRW